MTESEWLASDDPAAMLAEVDGHLRTYSTGHQEPVFKASDRKLRLWAVVAGPCEVCRGFGNGAEESASSYTEVSGASHAAFVCDAPCMSNPEKATLLRDIVGNPFRPWLCQRCARGPAFLHLAGDGIEFVCRRCRKTSEPARSAVLDLANAAYDHLDESTGHLDPFRLALVADALEEAGCDNVDLLQHLRGRACPCPFPHLAHDSCDGSAYVALPHVRGCRALDLILGKE